MEGIRVIKEKVVDNVWCVKFAIDMKVFDALSSDLRNQVCYASMAPMCTDLDRGEYEFTIHKSNFKSLLVRGAMNISDCRPVSFYPDSFEDVILSGSFDKALCKGSKVAEVAKYLEHGQVIWPHDEVKNIIRAERTGRDEWSRYGWKEPDWAELHRSIGLPYDDLRMQPSLSTQAFLDELRMTEQRILNSYGVPKCLIQSESINNNQNKLSMENLKLQRGQKLICLIEKIKQQIQTLNEVVNGGPEYTCSGKSGKLVPIQSHNISVQAVSASGRGESISMNSEDSPEISAAWSNVLKAKTDLLIKQLQEAEEEFKAL